MFSCCVVSLFKAELILIAHNLCRINNSRVQTAVVQQGRISLALPNQEETNADDEKLVVETDDAPGEYKYLQKKALVS